MEPIPNKLSNEDREWIKGAITDGVYHAFNDVGIYTEHLEETRANFAYLAKLRSGSEETTKWAKRSAVAVFISSFFFVVYQGVMAIVKTLN